MTFYLAKHCSGCNYGDIDKLTQILTDKSIPLPGMPQKECFSQGALSAPSANLKNQKPNIEQIPKKKWGDIFRKMSANN